MESTLRDYLTDPERKKVDILKSKMMNAKTNATLSYYKWRIHKLLNKAEIRASKR